jgi:hypothetical protein
MFANSQRPGKSAVCNTYLCALLTKSKVLPEMMMSGNDFCTKNHHRTDSQRPPKPRNSQRSDSIGITTMPSCDLWKQETAELRRPGTMCSWQRHGSYVRGLLGRAARFRPRRPRCNDPENMSFVFQRSHRRLYATISDPQNRSEVAWLC